MHQIVLQWYMYMYVQVKKYTFCTCTPPHHMTTYFLQNARLNGATRIVKNPASSSRMSLANEKELIDICIQTSTHMYMYIHTAVHLKNEAHQSENLPIHVYSISSLTAFSCGNKIRGIIFTHTQQWIHVLCSDVYFACHDLNGKTTSWVLCT